jgi:hypothetical protein
VNSLYVSGVMRTHSGNQNQVLVSHSNNGGATWTQAAIDAVQLSPAIDRFTPHGRRQTRHRLPDLDALRGEE